MYLLEFIEEKKDVIATLTGLEVEKIIRLIKQNNTKAKKLSILLPKLIKLRDSYLFAKVKKEINLRDLANHLDLGALKPFIKDSRKKLISDMTIYFRPRSISNLFGTSINKLATKVEIPLFRIEADGKVFFLIREASKSALDKIFPNHLEVITFKSLVLKELVEKSKLRFTKLKIYIGEEIGGVRGIKYLTLEGTDVVVGEEEFSRRYKSTIPILHKLGAIVEVEINNILRISIDGKIYFETFRAVLIFIEFFVKKLLKIKSD